MSLVRFAAIPALLFAVACGSSDEGGGSSSAAPGGDAGPGPGADAGGDAGAPQLDFSAFDAAIDDFLATEGLAGATAVVVHRDHGQLHLAGYGSFPPDRVSLIASSSKILSAGILMKLVDEGKLDLDAPVSEVLGDWGTHKTDITSAQLVSNSSGLVGLIDDPLYAKYICQYVDTGTLAACAETIYKADDAADRVPPDSKFRYGGGQWQLAGGVAEKVSGMNWAALVHGTYVKPCGVASLAYTNQFLRATSEGGGGVAGGLGYPAFFQGDPANAPVSDNPSIEGGAYTNVADYGALLQMHLRGGLCGDTRVLSEESVARMQEDRLAAYDGTTGSPTFPGYGLGWWVSRDEPGVVQDPGAYGAVPLLDKNRGAAFFVVLEADSAKGAVLAERLRPIFSSIVDELN
ncbi:MAG: beta-lactamase family protein [Deltaproteobacteria bacterium]|nr:beta-lactamase family protein [Deltaproteobacteria bacterium]